jgi:BioD-like phosphotransacetylase family protein
VLFRSPSPAVLERAEERGVPLVSVETDTVAAADGLRRLFGRLRVKERAKIDLITELIDESIDLDRLVVDLQA